jgi:hypothetical protein
VFLADRVAAVSLPTAKQRGGLWLKPVIGLVALAAGVILSLSRTKGFGAPDTIWAEDARVFYQGTLRHGFVDLLFTPYNGYLHLVPRVLIEIVRIFPLSWAAEMIATMSALITSGCAVLVYRAARRHLHSPALRIAVAAPVALPYIGQLELANNFACLHFLFLYTAFWMVIWNPAHRRMHAIAALMLFCTVSSDPVAMVFFPLALLRWYTVRSWRGALPAAALGAGMVFQTVGILFRHALTSRNISPHYDPIWAVGQYLRTVVGQGLFTEHVDDRFGSVVHSGDAHYVAWALAAVALVLALLRVTEPNWPLVIVALVHSLLLFCGLAMQGGSAAPRYEFPAICLFLVAVAGLLTPRKDAAVLLTPYALPAYGALGLVALCVFGGYSQDMQWRGNGPSFASEMTKASAACGQPGARDTAVTVAPAFVPWTMTVPCDVVRSRDQFFR